MKPSLHRPWRLPARGLAVFHGEGDTARLSHYFLPRLLMADKRVLFLDGANSADPRLLERLARQRGVQFREFSRRIQIARAFTCFQLTELIARVPQFLRDFPARVLIVTAFPDLYFDEDVRDWHARVAFEQALANLRRWAGAGAVAVSSPWNVAPAFKPALLAESRGLSAQPSGEAATPLCVALFSSAETFAPPSARQRFFERACAAATEVWKFNMGEERRLGLTCERTVVGAKQAPFLPGSVRTGDFAAPLRGGAARPAESSHRR